MVQIELTSILTFSIATANSPSPPSTSTPKLSFLTSVRPLTTFPTHCLPTSPAFQRSNLHKLAKCDEAGAQAETWEWNVEGVSSAVANGRSAAN